MKRTHESEDYTRCGKDTEEYLKVSKVAGCGLRESLESRSRGCEIGNTSLPILRRSCQLSSGVVKVVKKRLVMNPNEDCWRDKESGVDADQNKSERIGEERRFRSEPFPSSLHLYDVR